MDIKLSLLDYIKCSFLSKNIHGLYLKYHIYFLICLIMEFQQLLI